MDSGTENMDWIARVLRRLVELTQEGGEINLVVTGINVGAQPYWNAEATMLMHTRGILVMTPEGAMVLTGKQALDYSGSVSAEDNLGHRRLRPDHGPQRPGAVLRPRPRRGLPHPARATTTTPTCPRRALPPPRAHHRPADRDVRDFPHGGDFSDGGRGLLRRDEPRPQEAVRDPPRDGRRHRPGPSARWSAGTACATPRSPWSGTPASAATPSACSASSRKPLPRLGSCPSDGPEQWTGGTLFPARREEGGARDQRGERQPAAGGARQPLGLRRLAGVDAQPAARVRRRDRPRRRELPRARSSSASSPAITAAPSSSSRAPSTRTWRWRRSKAPTPR